ncbi:2OG-Fe(II) oxygenase superfamily protein [Coniochaeta ligniaria NRRL 30616]|uniref:2OG-Fe(II) oxygenase superfamily protein n=1 Tax=Coniochaeta ligniaria NRRL 30616 TaxID=1408157 RepID=A0A1J7JQB2_9PEZI|nr:2OG-Fe(II) oxygenase superfamily protein [Coniochaeta ligniaria NRRL 30616]
MVAAAKIPVIDISDDANQLQVAKDLVEAAVEHGFIYIKNTGKDIPVDSIENAFNIAKVLFQAPLEEKQRCSIQHNNRGYSGMHVETLDAKNQRVGDYKEAFNIGPFADGKPQQPVPSNIVPYEAQIDEFQTYLYKMCLKINDLLGIGLDVQPPDFFKTRHLRENGASGTMLRLLHYPVLTATDASEEDVRAGAHSDYGSITMLFRLKGQAGLEVQTRHDGFAPVPVSPPGTEDDPAPPFLVNIGDLLSYWTNGLLRSTVHRVVFPGGGSKSIVDGETAAEPRYSIAYFCHPVGTTQLTPVPSERVKSYVPPSDAGKAVNPYSERKVMTADEHLQMRLRASYLKLYNDEK